MNSTDIDKEPQRFAKGTEKVAAIADKASNASLPASS
jgi:hypothetical protein